MFPRNVFGYNVRPHRFVRTYECYPVWMLPGSPREDVERGGKIIMPSSALEELTQLNVTYPMLFRVSSGESGRVSHCGVLEFVADEGRVYLPRWMMNNLALNPGEEVSVESTELPVATHAKFQPQSVDFLDISDSKAVLENTLRNFACLTTGDCIAISYNHKVYEVCVLDTRPEHAVCIIECDMSVEYVPPRGHEEAPSSVQSEESLERDTQFVPFSGPGSALVKTKKKTSVPDDGSRALKSVTTTPRGVPDYKFTVGVLKFLRRKPNKECRTAGECSTAGEGSKDAAALFEPFAGHGHVLKPSKQTDF